MASHVILMRVPQTLGGGQDPAQPLSAAGRVAAQAAALEMYGAGHHPGPLLASNSPAARETVGIIAAVVHVDPQDIHYADDFIGATPDTLEVAVRALAEPYTLVTLVSWEPAISELARILSQDSRAPSLEPGQWRHLPWPPRY